MGPKIEAAKSAAHGYQGHINSQSPQALDHSLFEVAFLEGVAWAEAQRPSGIEIDGRALARAIEKRASRGRGLAK